MPSLECDICGTSLEGLGVLGAWWEERYWTRICNGPYCVHCAEIHIVEECEDSELVPNINIEPLENGKGLTL